MYNSINERNKFSKRCSMKNYNPGQSEIKENIKMEGYIMFLDCKLH